MKMLYRLILIIMALLCLSSCSYKEFQENVNNFINYDNRQESNANEALPNKEIPDLIKNENANSEGTLNSNNTTESDIEKSDGDIIYATRGKNKIAIHLKGVGDAFAEQVKYISPTGSEVSNGKEGVYYTLNNVEVFDNFEVTGLSSDGKLLNSDAYFDYNKFILLEITANYIAPEGGEKRIKVSPYLMASYVYEKMPDDFLTRVGVENLEPIEAWFSDPPKEGDPELDPIHDKNCFMINDGESFTFKFGLLAGKEFVDNGNVFLRVGYLSDNTKNAVHQYFELFPNENYDWALSKEEAMLDLGKAYIFEKSFLNEAINVTIYGPDDKAIIKGVGDTLPKFLKYKYQNKNEYDCLGVEGIYITLDKVTVYDSLSDSGLTFDDLLPYERDYLNSGVGFSSVAKESYDSNYFIIADITAEYVAPNDIDKRVKFIATLGEQILVERKSSKYEDLDPFKNAFPAVVYYSGEIDDEGMASYEIKDGEKYSYKIGIKAGAEFVENNNVFLNAAGYNPEIEDYVYLLFELLPVE